jgi:hypothetical protein
LDLVRGRGAADLRDDGVEGGLGGVAAALRAVEDGAAGLKDGGTEEAVVAATIGSELVRSVSIQVRSGSG